jgi:tRNA wybutosine-synthesizing protein 2
MLALRAPSRNAEAVRLLMTESGILDKHHRIFNEGGFTEIPMLAMPLPGLMARLGELGAEPADSRDYPWRETFRVPFRDISAMLDIPGEMKKKLPRKWEQLGHVLILKFGKELDEWKGEIARAYAQVLGVDCVLRDTGGITGQFREPVMERLLGDDFGTVHVENQVRFSIDAARLMFSSGNVEERIRMATIPKPGEVVVDMFAGIGYFSVPMAVHSRPARIIAHEINPLAFDYLKRNIEMNNVAGIIEPVLGNCLDAEEGIADRVIMGYVGTTHEYLPKAIRILRGKGVIHYHETCPNRLMPARPQERVKLAAREGGKEAEILQMKRIKSYAPGVEHVVIDARIS